MATTQNFSGQKSNAGGSALPRHIAIIMDGNGRWAQTRFMPRTFGHRQGLEAAKRIVRAARKLGIEFLSLFTFSTENWKRTIDEVNFLMDLILRHLRNEYDFYRELGIRVVHSGDLAALSAPIQAEIKRVMDDTAQFNGLTVNLAINYGGRDEILRAAKQLVRQKLENLGNPATALTALESCTERDLDTFMDSPELPEVDLMIRTGGEKRISNFLLWKSAYAELSFSDRLWPDWDESDLLAAVEEFRSRTRRFGAVPEPAGGVR